MDYIKEIKTEKTDDFSVTAFEIMSSGKIDSIVPVSITENGNYITASYNPSGLSLLKNVISGTNQNVRLKMLSLTLDSIEDMKDHLLFPDKCILSIDNIYITGDYSKVKIMYIPVLSSSTENDIILELINEILCPDEMKEIRENIKSYITLHNPKPLRLRRFLEDATVALK